MGDLPNFLEDPQWREALRGVMGGGTDRNLDDRHPAGAGPAGVQPPAAWPPQSPDDYTRWTIWNLSRVLGDRFAREQVRQFVQEIFTTRWIAAGVPPWLIPPPSAMPLSVIGSGSSGNAVMATVISVAVSLGYYGIVRYFGHDTQNDAAGQGGLDWSTLTWDIAIQQPGGSFAAVPGYNGFPGQIGQVEDPAPVFIFVPEGCTVAVRASGSGGVVANLMACLHGWQWSVTNPGTQLRAVDHIAGIQR